MFWTNLFRKEGYFVNPFRDLFIEEFHKGGGVPATWRVRLEASSPGAGFCLTEQGGLVRTEPADR